MILSDLFQIITLTLRLRLKSIGKKVSLQNYIEYEPISFQDESLNFYLSDIDKDKFKILKDFFILTKDRLFNISKENPDFISFLIDVLKKDKISINNGNKQKKKEFEDFNIRFFTDNKKSMITIEVLDEFDIYGLGLKFSKFNRKGSVFDNFNTDNPYHSNFTDNLYSTSNIFYIFNPKNNITYTFILDFPGLIRYDFCKSSKDKIKIGIESSSFQLIILKSDDFKKAIDKTYILINDLYKPPFHSFGYTYSHWGIKSLDEVEKIYERHKNENILLSNICLDIDYMDEYKNFTINKNFGRIDLFQKVNKKLKENNLFLIPIIDAGIKKEAKYKPYEDFLKEGVLVKNDRNENYLGKVWPGFCVFPDFFEQKDRIVFSNLLEDWIDKTETVGAWLDMNEPSIFSEKDRTLPENARFLNGKIDNLSMHNMYPYFQAKATIEAFLKKGIRPMLFSRSGYTFIGQFCGNWTGDNQPRYSHLKKGFEQIISLSLSGVMYTGTDIGGFWFNPSEKLLIKWFIASLFHPLFRNHSSIFAKSREIYSYKQEIKQKIKNIINIRYFLLPTIYSLFLTSIYNKKPYIMPYIYKKNDKTKISEDIIVISDTIAYDPFETNIISNNEFIKHNLKELGDIKINIFIKKGKGICISKNPGSHKNIFESAPFKVLGVFDEKNSFETILYLDDGQTSNSIENFAILNIKFFKEDRNIDKLNKEVKLVFSNLSKSYDEKIQTIVDTMEVVPLN